MGTEQKAKIVKQLQFRPINLLSFITKPARTLAIDIDRSALYLRINVSG